MTNTGDADRSARSRLAGVAGMAALLLIAIASVMGMAPTAPARSDASADVFSASRAMTHISAISDEPRPVGSAHHGESKAYLLDQLASLGWQADGQESVGMFDFGGDGSQNIGAVANVIATKPGTAPTGTVLLTAHYDTVVGSPGAADDGIGVGVLLETARALSTTDAPRNSVMILLTDAEEVGLLGAEAFVRERAQALRLHSACRRRTASSLRFWPGHPARSQTRVRRRPSRRCRTIATSPRSSRRGCTA